MACILKDWLLGQSSHDGGAADARLTRGERIRHRRGGVAAEAGRQRQSLAAAGVFKTANDRALWVQNGVSLDVLAVRRGGLAWLTPRPAGGARPEVGPAYGFAASRLRLAASHCVRLMRFESGARCRGPCEHRDPKVPAGCPTIPDERSKGLRCSSRESLWLCSDVVIGRRSHCLRWGAVDCHYPCLVRTFVRPLHLQWTAGIKPQRLASAKPAMGVTSVNELLFETMVLVTERHRKRVWISIRSQLSFNA